MNDLELKRELNKLSKESLIETLISLRQGERILRLCMEKEYDLLENLLDKKRIEVVSKLSIIKSNFNNKEELSDEIVSLSKEVAKINKDISKLSNKTKKMFEKLYL